MMKNIIKKGFCLVAATLPASSLLAMEHLSDNALASVSGQDGLSLSIASPVITADSVAWQTDGTTADQSQLVLRDISLQRVGVNGANLGVGDMLVDVAIDAGSNGITAGLRMDLAWQRARVRIDEMRIGSSIESIGTQVIDSSGRLLLENGNGFLNSSTDTARVLLEVNDADIYYRQGGPGAPEMLIRNLDFKWDMAQGIAGIDSEGILVKGDADFNLTFDLFYDPNPGASPFTYSASTDRAGLLFGWSGGHKDAEFRLKAGGLWNHTDTTGSGGLERFDRTQGTQGLNISMRWNYDPNFAWVIGEAAGARTRLEFGEWQKLPEDPGQPDRNYAFNVPFFGVDMVNAARGPGGLCWGSNIDGPANACQAPQYGKGQYIDLAPTEQALALVLRDFSWRAYATKVSLFEPLAPANNEEFDWTLVATVGDLDGNIFLYSGSSTPGTPGLRTDFVITAQTFDEGDADGDGNTFEQGPNWNYGTHFMIGDSTAGAGIGLANASLLLASKGMELSLNSDGINLSSDQVRVSLSGALVSGDLPNMNSMVRLSDVNLNLEFDLFDFTVMPSPTGSTDTYLGYKADLRLANTNIAGFSQSTLNNAQDDGSFFSLSEPDRPDEDIRFADITGSLSIRNGRLDLKSSAETPAGRSARLVFENDLLIGLAAPDAGGEVLEVGRIEFGNQALGRMVIPGGEWHAKIWLEKQPVGL